MSTEKLNYSFGDILRKTRKQKGYTLAQLAEMSGISKRMIGHYETQVKKPAIEKLKKLADALNISVDELMGFSVTTKKHTLDDVSFKIIKKVRIIEKLPTRDQNAIFRLINSLAEKNKIKPED